VRGISLKLQEEERERRMDFIPEVSAVNTDVIQVDADTLEMLKSMGMSDLPGVSLQPVQGGGGGGNFTVGGNFTGERNQRRG